MLEAAYQNGYKTGLVATSRITHATPGSFAAHVVDRDLEAAIAVQETGQYALGQNVDLLFGGGKCYFEPNTTAGSCRQDKVDLLKYVRSQDWDLRFDATSLRAMTAADATKVNLGLFAQGVPPPFVTSREIIHMLRQGSTCPLRLIVIQTMNRV